MTRASIPSTCRSTIRSGLVLALALTTTIAAAPIAHASAPADEAPPADDAAAQRRADGLALYEQANAKYDAGDYPGAVDDFKASFDLLGDTLLLYNIAVCYDRMDEFDAALEYFKRYRAVAPPAEQADVDRRVSSINARKAARTRSTGSNSADATPTTGPTERRPDARGQADTGAGPTTTKVFTPTVLALAGVSVAALGVGLGFGLASSKRSDAADDGCPEVDGVRLCTAQGSDDLDRARQFGVVSAASLAVGGALAIAAIAVLATNATRAKKQRNRGAQARIFPTPLGVSGRF